MSTRRDNPGPRPTALGDVLDGTRRATLQRSRAAVDRDTWRRAVGRRIAERTDVGQLKQGELTVYVASAAWAQELSLLTREIAERLLAHGVRIEKVRFRIKVQQAAEMKPVRPLAKPPAQKPLPAELRAHLERVPDDELRGAIAGAAELALSRLAGREQKATATSAPQAARSPRVAAARTAPTDQSSAASRASQPRKREDR
jgi:hypothetical protein